MAAPGGPPAQCYTGESTDNWIQLALGAGLMDTTLRFGGGEADLELSSVSLAGSYPLGDKTSARIGLGRVVEGELRPDSGVVHAFEPGWLVYMSLDYHKSEGNGSKPSVDLIFQFGVTWAETVEQGTERRADYSAADLRFGVRTTWVIGTRFYPYLAGRVFGGPITWEAEGESLTGSDVHHYQLAAGAAAGLGPVLLYVEWAPLGEQGLSAGLGTAW